MPWSLRSKVKISDWSWRSYMATFELKSHGPTQSILNEGSALARPSLKSYKRQDHIQTTTAHQCPSIHNHFVLPLNFTNKAAAYQHTSSKSWFSKTKTKTLLYCLWPKTVFNHLKFHFKLDKIKLYGCENLYMDYPF